MPVSFSMLTVILTFQAPRTPDEPGKGCYWLIDPQFEERLISQAFRRRRFHDEQRPQRNGQASAMTSFTYHALPAAGQQFAFIQSPQWSSVSTANTNFGAPAPGKFLNEGAIWFSNISVRE